MCACDHWYNNYISICIICVGQTSLDGLSKKESHIDHELCVSDPSTKQTSQKQPDDNQLSNTSGTGSPAGLIPGMKSDHPSPTKASLSRAHEDRCTKGQPLDSSGEQVSKDNIKSSEELTFQKSNGGQPFGKPVHQDSDEHVSSDGGK